jgi:RNA polymerase sigma-70 factor (ECF subfamily)
MDILRQRRRTPRTDSLDDIEAPEEVTNSQQGGPPLEEALLILSDNHREILRFRYFGDLTYAEIAVALGIPMGTVMSRLHLARMALATILSKEEP